MRYFIDRKRFIEKDNSIRNPYTKKEYQQSIAICEDLMGKATQAVSFAKNCSSICNRYSFSFYGLEDAIKDLENFIKEVKADIKSMKDDMRFAPEK